MHLGHSAPHRSIPVSPELTHLCLCGVMAAAEPDESPPRELPHERDALQDAGRSSRGIVFEHVTVIDVLAGRGLPDHSVVVARERVVAVGPSGQLEVPAGAVRVDGRSKYLLPGLADMHVHAQNRSDLVLLAAAGVTLVRNMFGAPHHLQVRAAIDGPESFAPRFVTAGPIIDGDPPTWPGSTVVTSVDDAERVIAEQKQSGYDFVKVYNSLSAPVYAALAKAALRHGFPLVGHVPNAVPLADIFAAGQRSIEHMQGYPAALEKDPARRTGGWLAPELDEGRIAELADATAASGVWNCPTLVVIDRVSRLDAVAELEAATRWLELASPNLRPHWDPRKSPRAARFAAQAAQLRRHYTVCARMLRAVCAAGGKLLVGTDMGNPFVVPGASLHDEIELLVASGVPRAAVLRAATAGAHEFLGQSADGIVAAGARADLVLADTDPLLGPIAIPPAGVMMRPLARPGEAAEQSGRDSRPESRPSQLSRRRHDVGLDDEDLAPQSLAWCERLARTQRGYFYDWSSTLEPGNGEELYTELVDVEVRPSLDVLDAGCGHGLDVLRVAPRVRSALGYDRLPAFIDLAEQERRARGIENARFVCVDSKGPGMPVPAKSIDLFLSRRGPRNWIDDAGRAGRPGAVLLMLSPIRGEVPAWNDDLPEPLRIPLLPPVDSTRLEATRDDIGGRLRKIGAELTHEWYREVGELFADPRELYRQRIWGRDRGLVPAYEDCAAAFESLFARHVRDGRLRLEHRRWIFRAVLER